MVIDLDSRQSGGRVQKVQINKTNQKERLYSYLLKLPSFNSSAPECDHSGLPEN